MGTVSDMHILSAFGDAHWERHAMSHSYWSRTGAGLVHTGTHFRHEMLGELLGGAIATLWLWATRRRTRRALSDIAEWHPHLLNDVGLTRRQARREADKFFWQG